VLQATWFLGGEFLVAEDECGCGGSDVDESASSEGDECKRTGPRITIPDPEITNEKKYRCPIDQQEYDSREDYNAHCKEEHDVT
jgi:hypothetical protein